MSLSTWYRNLGSGFPRDAYLARDKVLVPHFAESYKLPRHRLTMLAVEVADWRTEDHWIFCAEQKVRWGKKAVASADLRPHERQQLEAELRADERELATRLARYEDDTRRLFGRQPRLYLKEFPAAVRHLAALRQAEDDAQRQNQAQLITELQRENDAILDELLELGLSLEDIQELKNG